MNSRTIALAMGLALSMGCGRAAPPSRPSTDAGSPVPRTLDATPVESSISSPVRDGRAEAYFDLYTGADQGGERAKEAALVVVVRYDSKQLRQRIASCAQPSLGSALGGGDIPGEVDRAFCNGEYVLLAHDGTVSVRRLDLEDAERDVTQIPLPASIEEVVRPERQ